MFVEGSGCTDYGPWWICTNACKRTDVPVVYCINLQMFSLNFFVWRRRTHCVSKESALWRQSCSLLYKSGISLSTGGRVVVVGGWSDTQVCVCFCVCAVFGGEKTQEELWSLLQRRLVHRNTFIFLHLCHNETSWIHCSIQFSFVVSWGSADFIHLINSIV